MKKAGLIIFFILISFFSVICISIGAFYLIDAMIFPDPEKPAVTYGEFPFTIVYEIDGEIKTIKDSYVCKYTVRNDTASMGKYRYWEILLKSNSKERCSILWSDGNTSLYCQIGSAAYYMGDKANDRNLYTSKGFIEPFFFEKFQQDGLEHRRVISVNDIWEKYKIRIISYETSDPIENSFPEESS